MYIYIYIYENRTLWGSQGFCVLRNTRFGSVALIRFGASDRSCQLMCFDFYMPLSVDLVHARHV